MNAMRLSTLLLVLACTGSVSCKQAHRAGTRAGSGSAAPGPEAAPALPPGTVASFGQLNASVEAEKMVARDGGGFVLAARVLGSLEIAGRPDRRHPRPARNRDRCTKRGRQG